MSTKLRKLDHIRICVDSSVEHEKPSMLGQVMPVHQSLPELRLSDVDASARFLGKRLSAPIMVAGMTGGHEAAARINCAIAQAVEELGLAMGVGSQRAAIEDESLAWTFRVARDCAPTAPIVANIGAAQLVAGWGVEELRRAVEMVEADAIAVHLNPAQEVFQPEGDHDFRGAIERIAVVAEEAGVPLIVKETGHGLSMETVLALYSRGIRYFDVSGAGGTSWVRVEYYRGVERGYGSVADAARDYSSWGIPTALSIVEARWAAPSACIIASGGVRTGLDVLVSIMLGADMAAVALPVIRAYASQGVEGVKRYLERLVYGLRAGMMLVGAGRLEELRSKPLVVGSGLYEAMLQRGIDPKIYMNATRLMRGWC